MFCAQFFLLINFFVYYVFATCPPGQIQSVSNSTICYSFLNAKTNWFAAMEKCKENDGNLVSIHDMFENMFISGEAKTIFTDSDDFWIGGIFNSLSQGKWSWIDNSTFDFVDWDKGQLQNTTESLCTSTVSDGGKWRAGDCFIEKPFTCEFVTISSKPSTTSTTISTTTTTTQKPKPCPDSWIFLNYTNFCYKAFETYSSWYDAEAECVKQGGHLASIHSEKENLFIAYIASNDGSNTCEWFYQAWIGLSYNGDSFGWSDNTPFDYSSWVKDAPYDAAERKCVLTWVGQTCFGDGWDNGAAEWDNRECGTRALNYVCKKYRNY